MTTQAPGRARSDDHTHPNRLLREYLPNSGDLGSCDQAALDAIAYRLKNRSRTVLGWRTPAEAFAEVHWNDGWDDWRVS